MIPVYRYWDQFLEKYQPVLGIDFGLPGSDAPGFIRVHLPEGGCMGGDCWEPVDSSCLELAMGNTRDMDGKPIYSGDVLEQILPERSGLRKHHFIVAFDEDQASFTVRRPGWTFSQLAEQKNRKIVGNIHENPEFLEVQP